MNKDIKGKKLSIIVPVYNGEKYLVNTIDSILSSSFSNIELILIDDGSNDNSYSICANKAKTDHRIRLYHKDNGGIVSTRNYGLTIATGDFLCFCDQDDLVSSNMYQLIINRMESEKSDIGFCSTGRLINEEMTVYEYYKDAFYSGDSVRSQLLYPLLFHEFKVPVTSHSMPIYPSIWKCVFSKELFNKYHLHCTRFIDYEDDLILFIEVLATAQKVSVISDTLYFWRLNPQSESNRKKYIIDLEIKQARLLKYLISVLSNNGIPDTIIYEYKKAISCRFYLDILDNISSPLAPLTFKEKLNHIRVHIYSSSFKDNSEIIKYVGKEYLRAKLMYSVLLLKNPYISYIINLIFNYVKNSTILNTRIINFERKLKKN